MAMAMSNPIFSETKILICQCHMPGHMLIFHIDENEVYVSVHLCSNSLRERIKNSVLHILGKDVPYGMFQEFLVKPDDANNLQSIVDKLRLLKSEADCSNKATGIYMSKQDIINKLNSLQGQK